MKLHTLLTPLLILAGFAQATTTGINTDPAGASWDRNQAGTAYAQWDAFTGANSNLTFSNLAAGSSFATTGAGLSQTVPITNFVQGAGIYDFVGQPPSPSVVGTDIFLNGGQNVTFNITASLNFTAYGVTLQIKRAGSTAGLADSAGFTPVLTINSLSFSADGFSTAIGTGDTNTSGGTWAVTTWYWGASLAGLANTGTSSVSIALPKNSTASRSLDTFAVDFGSIAAVAPVPEPGTYAIAFALLAFIGFRVSRIRRA